MASRSAEAGMNGTAGFPREKKNARVGERGAACGVGSHSAQRGKGLAGAMDEKQRSHALL